MALSTEMINIRLDQIAIKGIKIVVFGMLLSETTDGCMTE
jgi:hypothetical protein